MSPQTAAISPQFSDDLFSRHFPSQQVHNLYELYGLLYLTLSVVTLSSYRYIFYLAFYYQWGPSSRNGTLLRHMSPRSGVRGWSAPALNIKV